MGKGSQKRENTVENYALPPRASYHKKKTLATIPTYEGKPMISKPKSGKKSHDTVPDMKKKSCRQRVLSLTISRTSESKLGADGSTRRVVLLPNIRTQLLRQQLHRYQRVRTETCAQRLAERDSVLTALLTYETGGNASRNESASASSAYLQADDSTTPVDFPILEYERVSDYAATEDPYL